MNKNNIYNGLTNKTLLHSYIDKFLEISSGNAFYKDKKGVYLEVNDLFIRVSGMQSQHDVVGKTDLDLIWQEQAPIMMKNDQAVAYTGCSKISVEPAQSPNGSVYSYLNHKVPVQSRMGKIIGTFGISFLIEDVNSLLIGLNEASTLSRDSVVCNNIKEALIANTSTHGLTKQQASCLYYLVRGMTMKQIAATLNLAPKTVEHYLDAVKIKLNCFTRSELIEKALAMGFSR